MPSIFRRCAAVALHSGPALGEANSDRAGAGAMSDKMAEGLFVEALRGYIETLPGGVAHPIFKLYDNGRLDNMAEISVPPGHLFVMGDNRDNSADSRVSVRDGGVGLLPIDNLVGRVDAVVGSWNPAVRSQPITDWLSGFRVARFFTSVH